jgi:hypothetical protein
LKGCQLFIRELSQKGGLTLRPKHGFILELSFESDMNQDDQSIQNKARIANRGEIISLFFYDVISRIIPGVVVLSLYSQLPETLLNNDNSSWIFVLGVIGLAWLIGVVIEYLGYDIFAYSLGLAHHKGRCKELHSFLLSEHPSYSVDPLLAYRQNSEKIMSRSMALITTSAVFLNPTFCNTSQEWPWYDRLLAFLVAVIFSLHWYQTKRGQVNPKPNQATAPNPRSNPIEPNQSGK